MSLKDAYDNGGTLTITEGPRTIQQSGKMGAFVITLPAGPYGDPPPLEVIRVDEDGDVYVRGNLVTNDVAIVNALSNASAGLIISRMGAWEKLCDPCRSMLSCEDAARRLGKPDANNDDASIEAEVRERLAGESDPTSSIFAYEAAALLRIIDAGRQAE